MRPHLSFIYLFFFAVNFFTLIIVYGLLVFYYKYYSIEGPFSQLLFCFKPTEIIIKKKTPTEIKISRIHNVNEEAFVNCKEGDLLYERKRGREWDWVVVGCFRAHGGSVLSVHMLTWLFLLGGSRSPHVTSVPLFPLAHGSHGARVKSEPSLESEAVNAGSWLLNHTTPEHNVDIVFLFLFSNF